ncbi:conserved hypothetical protein [Leishmania mexicana MHOM/GT/2001/U1103]|uniref:Uncharacterized protein n=1 Tax=Leishmania mexicana (strain MHOM/GT/2001/U1103) TaxID=929439 RepID=E9B4X1_LEIMU|nr:conserved hypothetical protein [Leishmania mexicana MHOM/GT/2001/U1103]CBZ30290.1 conserved hypothetical protein [Leishmania mexicana MHOM/GT/2001/U1103]
MPPCAATVLRCARRCSSTSSVNSVPNKEEGLSSSQTSLSWKSVQSSTSRSDDATANLATSIAELLQHRQQMTSVYMGLLADRRVQYRDQLLLSSLGSIQTEMQVLLRRLLASRPEAAASPTQVPQQAPPQMTSDAVRRLKETWTRINGVAIHCRDAATRHAYFSAVRDFYATLICSGLLRTESEVRLILSEMRNTDLIEPDASFYEVLFVALWSLDDVRESTVATGMHGAAGSRQTPEIVAGEVRQLRRSVAGDLAGYYMGHALAQLSTSSAPTASAAPMHTAVRPETWEVFFATLANTQPAPKLMNLWWKRLLEWLDEQVPLVSAKASIGALDKEASVAKGAPVPYQAVHAVLAWCAQSREMEKALNYFNAVNQRGVTLHATTMPNISLSAELVGDFTRAGCLTSSSTHTPVQELQLALLVKLMVSTKSVKMDGGLRALVVRDVQRQISPDVLYTAPWAVINDLIAGLSVPSAMQLLRRCSSSLVAETASSTLSEKRSSSDDRACDDGATVGSAAKGRGTREIPFFVWASLLRRCCREHLQDEAESLFVFLRKKFSITAPEKRELIEIMMRMYTTMHPADFPSAMDVFLQHVLRTPEGEPMVKPDAVLYGLLVKGADSRNAAMMVFLEACAAGVALNEELFEALMGSTQYKTVASLSRKLPHDYAASSLDAQLKIPANADAHLRREEALRARGKPLYDSTGDVG